MKMETRVDEVPEVDLLEGYVFSSEVDDSPERFTESLEYVENLTALEQVDSGDLLMPEFSDTDLSEYLYLMDHGVSVRQDVVSPASPSASDDFTTLIDEMAFDEDVFGLEESGMDVAPCATPSQQGAKVILYWEDKILHLQLPNRCCVYKLKESINLQLTGMQGDPQLRRRDNYTFLYDSYIFEDGSEIHIDVWYNH